MTDMPVDRDGKPLHSWVENGSGLCAACGHSRGSEHLIGIPIGPEVAAEPGGER